MSKKSIVITGATGNLGSKVAAELIEGLQPIRVTGRQAEKLLVYNEKADVMAGDLEDQAFLKQLLHKTNRVFLVLPSLQHLTLQ